MTMPLERCEIEVRAGSEDAFASTLEDGAVPLLQNVPGVRATRWGRGVETPAKFLLLVEWESLAAHQNFNGSEASRELRRLIGAHSVGGTMEHFEMR
jgi:heme-degrading monooxygenase HmoA